jgi:uncharacterized protein
LQAEFTSAPPKRRRRLKAVFGMALVAALALGLWAFWLEPDSLKVNRVTVQLAGWPAAFENFKIVAVSDLHVGSPHVDLDKLRRVVQTVNNERPDVVVLLGDYVIQDVVGGTFVAPEDFAPLLGELRAGRGVFAVIGNHDWWLDGGRVKRAFEQAGLRVLSNEAVRVERGGAGFWLAGLDDLWTLHHDVAATMRQVTSDEPVVALSHSPDIFPELPPRVALTLSGHTHGGQVNLPLFGRRVVPSRYGDRYAIGLVEEDGKQLFVTPGVGTSIIPVRFRVPPEVSVLTIKGSRKSEVGSR